jgi:MFS family permease
VSELLASWLTISVQLGFILGTFLYALLNISDIFGARRVYMISALGGALFNGLFALASQDLGTAVFLRFLTGITLAGIYPVGMKIIASWFRKGLGGGLGIMVGALTLGTAFPYLLAGLRTEFDWRLLILVSSMMTILGGLIIAVGVKDGPHLTQRAKFKPRMAAKVFKDRAFRLQSLGYFGHMWELYAFWSLIVFYLYGAISGAGQSRISLVVFLVISAGAAGCVFGGLLSKRIGERRVALFAMCISGALCLFSGFIHTLPPWILVGALLAWGFFVVADSPQFSALAALSCPPAYTGTALTIQNGLGFAVTVLSIQLLPVIAQAVGWRWAFTFLAPGPMLGAWAMSRLGKMLSGKSVDVMSDPGG